MNNIKTSDETYIAAKAILEGLTLSEIKIPTRIVVRKAYDMVVDFNAEDMEQFLGVLSAYFMYEGGDVYTKSDFQNTGVLLKRAYESWKNRSNK